MKAALGRGAPSQPAADEAADDGADDSENDREDAACRVAPRQKERHEAIFVLKEPLSAPSPALLNVRLEQRSKTMRANRGRFRLSGPRGF